MKQPSVSRLIFLLTPLFSFPFILKDIYDKKKVGLVMFTLFIGVCTYLFLPTELMDSARRYQLYENFQSMGYEEFKLYLSFRSDVLFYSLIYIFAQLNIKFQILIFLFGCFNIGVPLYVFNNVIDKKKLTNKFYFLAFLLIIFSLGLPYIFSGIRQLVAFNLVLLSFYHYFFKRNFKYSLFFIVVGTITHFSVFIFIPILFLISKLNIRFILFGIILAFLVGALLPNSLIQNLFLTIDINSQVYSSKLEAYTYTVRDTDETTDATALAKTLKQLWFYLAIIYAIFSRRKDTPLYKIFLLVLLPVSFLITFPGIAGRYIDFLKMIFALLLIDDYISKKNKWFLIFLVLFLIAPLYDVFRLMTSSFLAIYSLEHLTIPQILNVTYTTEDLIKVF